MTAPALWTVIPFATLLALIALGPLFFGDWWGKHYPKVSIGLGIVVVAIYLTHVGGGLRVAEVSGDYIRFLVLVGSLFVVAGGIHISVKGEATPLANLGFLALGALAANLIGTTGASMLLIRPWLRMNRYRVTGHHVVFFIFVVSNVGGALTPIGDPPLYLGYLKGVPFWWVTAQLWPIWLVGVGILLAMFFVVDLRNYRRAPKSVREKLAEPADHWRFEGLGNVALLAVVLGAAFIERPPFLREAIMVMAAIASYFTTGRQVHESNHFTFHPIKEVAILFAGIFATMMPALDWLQASASKFGDPSAGLFFFGSGALSSVLDNAPTYLAFLSAAHGALVDPGLVTEVQRLAALPGGPDLAAASGPFAEAAKRSLAFIMQWHPAWLAHGKLGPEEIGVAHLLSDGFGRKIVAAISAGAVFFGANTYIGNGPNFMVKAIADQQKVHTPSFLAYVAKFTVPFMIPMLLVVWMIFFRH
ncbi:MAG TPA: sodium:proton antiporter [Candidatus Limnocylindria bacterium]|nr:sodium:proton antiporter [Candidatus Limnocylindria bacterium]